MNKIFMQCIKSQNIKSLQILIDNKEIDLASENLNEILIYLSIIFWKENIDINLDFFEFLLKNNIPINMMISKEYTTIPLEKIVDNLENNRNSLDGYMQNNYKKETCDPSKYNIFEDKLNKMLILLVQYGANPNTILDYAIGSENISILEYADTMNKELFRLLVTMGANINIEYIPNEDEYPNTPLSNAIDEQNFEIIKLLIEYNVDFDFWSDYSLFREFESYYLWKTVDKLKKIENDTIQKSKNIILNKVLAFEKKQERFKQEQKNKLLVQILNFLNSREKLYLNCKFYGKSIFDLAVEDGDIELIQFFIENNIELMKPVEMIDESKNHYKNIDDFAKQIITHTRDTQDKRIRNKEKESDLIKSLKSKDISLFKKSLTNNIAKFLPVIDFIEENYPIEFIKISIEKGADIDFQNNDGKTALMLACEKNDDDIIDLLLNYEPMILIEDKNLKTALQYTVSKFHLTKKIFFALQTNKGKKLSNILKKFSNDDKLRYTNHPWDVFEFNNGQKLTYDNFMKNLHEAWDEIKFDLQSLSKNLYKKIDKFLFNENEIGFSYPDIKKQLQSDKKPHDIKIDDNITLQDKMDEFKGLFVVKDDIDELSLFEIFASIREEVEPSYEINLDDLLETKVDKFFTDVETVKLALKNIFNAISERASKNNTIIVKSLEIDDKIVIKIIHKNSKSSKSAKDLAKTINITSDFADTYSNLKSLCDWSVETICQDSKRYKIDYLYPEIDNDKPHFEPIEHKIEGFTHILRFNK